MDNQNPQNVAWWKAHELLRPFWESIVAKARKKKLEPAVEVVPDPQAIVVMRRLRASKKTHPSDPYTKAVAEFHDAFGVLNPDEPTFPERESGAHLDYREVISCMREVAHIAREKSKKYGGKNIPLQRAQLMCEELHELLEAIARHDPAHTTAEAADMVYVTVGTLLQLGLGKFLFPIFEEVHLANMSKLDPKTGKPFFDDSGKITKGPYYQKPNLRRVMNEAREVQKLGIPVAGFGRPAGDGGPTGR